MMPTPTQHKSGKQEAMVLGAAFLCAVIHHALFYDKTWGISYPLFTLCFYAFFYWAAKDRCGLRPDRSWLLLIPVFLLSLAYAVFTNFLFMVLNALAIPLLVIVHTTWTIRKDSVRWFDAGMVLAVLEQIFVHSLRLIPLPVITLVRLMSGNIKSDRARRLGKVLAGVLLSLPLVLLVSSLLASADAVFGRTLSRLPELLGGLNLGTLLFRALWIVAVATALFVYVWGLLYPKPKRERTGGAEAGWDPGPGAHAGKPLRIDATIAATLLFMLNAVYVLFAAIQFSYFFAGGGDALPEGVTYAEYARRGFAELVVVTVINFTVLMTALHATDRTDRTMDRLLRALLAMLVLCTAVMLCSAYMRLSLYELAYGYTITRVLVHSFMIFLGVLFAIALYKLWNDRFRLLQPYAIIAIAAYVLMNYIQVDVIVASNNLKRYESTGRIDADYLGGLSYEAVPYLLELRRKYPEVEGTEEALQRMKHRLEDWADTSWTEYNFSKQRAADALRSAN